MPVREDILTPVPGSNPSGENLEYAPVYDQIKEARREDDDAPQGDWQRTRKTADWKAVMQLTNDAIATRSKDLQLAAWLTEALLKREGFGGFRAGLQLNKALIEAFWDTLYPEIEDGDVELRATPLEWIGSRLNDALKQTPITKAGHSFFKYKESRAVGYEEEADTNAKQDARQAAIDDGKVTAELFDRAFKETSKDFYQKAVENLDGTLESLQALNALCGEKFGDAAPSFVKLREAIEEVRHTVNTLYQQKRKEAGELDEPAPVEETQDEPSPVDEDAVIVSQSSGAAAAPARTAAKKAVAGIEPAGKEEVPARLVAIARFLREQDGYDPGPYLLVRGYRWGELRRDMPTPSQTLLEAPSTETRTGIKAAMLESDWAKVVELGEEAMAQPCGRGWLDLQRYVVHALQQWQAPLIAAAIKSEVRALLGDIPELRRWTLMDDTPTANAETQAWLDELMAGEAVSASASAPVMAMQEDEDVAPEGEAELPDSYDLALQALREGRSKEAIEIIAMDVSRQSSGRSRFRRKQQLAGLCMKLGKIAVARPILEELLREIDEHKLEDWESSDTIVYPMTMLLECLAGVEGGEAVRQRIYDRICRLDPVQALNCKP